MPSLQIWRGLCVFLLAVILLQFYLIVSEDTAIPHIQRHYPPYASTLIPIKRPSLGKWKYNTERDSRNIGLSGAQCDYAFPNLYYEIDRAVTVWQDRKHNITKEDIDISWRRDAAIRLLIYDNTLRIVDYKGAWNRNQYRKRTTYVLLQLHRAILGAVAAGESLPNIEFSVVVDDMSLIPAGKQETRTIWAFARSLSDRAQDRVWLMPDFNFFASPPVATSFVDEQRKARLHDAFIIDKIPKAVWRGVKWTNKDVRGHLLDVAEGKDWADVMEVSWSNKSSIVAADEMCKYMFTVHTEGRSWSGRLKYLLNCDSVPIIHKLDWHAEYYHLLVPDGPQQNYIPVNREFSDLEKQVKYYLANPKEAQRIASNAVATFRNRYTSPAAETCYWRRLIHAWSMVAFEPEIYETNADGKQVVRGMPIEEFIWIPNDNFDVDP